MNSGRQNALPDDFNERLTTDSLSELKLIFETCDLNARGKSNKQPALAFDTCPDELAQWLVAEGADLSAPDKSGNTPLHIRSRSHRGRISALLDLGADVNSVNDTLSTPLHSAATAYHIENVRLLLDHGAEIDAVDRSGLTPLETALYGCSNIHLEHMAGLAECLLAAGASKTPRMRGFVEEIGKRFEFHRSGFNAELVDAASAALDRLYTLFSAPPVPARTPHDGRSPIAVKAANWREQHQDLWWLLVPSSGPALTVQGEVIRISGRHQ